MNKFEKPSGGIFINEEELESLTMTSEGKQEITVLKGGVTPSIGDIIQLALPDNSSAVGKVVRIDTNKRPNKSEIVLEILPD